MFPFARGFVPILAFVPFLLFLAACQMGPKFTKPEGPYNLPKVSGLLAVQVVSNPKSLPYGIPSWSELRVVSTADDGREYILQPSANGNLESAVFVGVLPPGEYAIRDLIFQVSRSGQARRDFPIVLLADAPKSLGRFRVSEDRITDLGTIVFQPLNPDAVKGTVRSHYVISQYDSSESLTEYILETFPDASKDLDPQPALGWSHVPSEHPTEEMSEVFREFSTPLHEHWLVGGEIVLSGLLGQLHRRIAASEWRRIDTGFSRQVSEVRIINDMVVVGGERGLFAASASIEGPWRQLPGPGTQEAVYWIGEDGEGRVFALTARNTQRVLYSISADLMEWRELRTFEVDREGFLNRAMNAQASIGSDGRLVVFAEGGRFEYASHDMAPEQKRIGIFQELLVQPDNTLIGLPDRWFAQNVQAEYSTDGGVSWHRAPYIRGEELMKAETRSVPVIVNRQHFLQVSHKAALRSYAGVRRAVRQEVTQYEESPRLRDADAGGVIRSWGDEVQVGCTELLPQISTREAIFRACDNGRIFVSSDYGMSWELDLEKVIDVDDVPTSLLDDELKYQPGFY